VLVNKLLINLYVILNYCIRKVILYLIEFDILLLTRKTIRIKMKKLNENVGVSSGASVPTNAENKSSSSTGPTESFLDFSSISKELERTVMEDSITTNDAPSLTTKSQSPQSRSPKSLSVSVGVPSGVPILELSAETPSVVLTPSPLTEEEAIICGFIHGLFDDCASDLVPQSKWVKPVDFRSTIRWVDYHKKEMFQRVALITPDDEVVGEPKTKGKKSSANSRKKAGDKLRQTLIQFINTISVELWKETVEWIYVLVINGYIVKIGGTRVGLDERCRSYLSGHCTPEKGGKSVSTNAFIYHTFHWYLQQGMSIEMYGYRIKPEQHTDTMLGFTATYNFSRFHVWEALLLGEFEKMYGKKPPLSSNSDPKYRK
jgi:hypothetical protein